MDVEQIGHRFWMVTEDARWWTVRATGFGGFLILNSRDRVVVTNGPTGQRILASVRASHQVVGRK